MSLYAKSLKAYRAVLKGKGRLSVIGILLKPLTAPPAISWKAARLSAAGINALERLPAPTLTNYTTFPDCE